MDVVCIHVTFVSAARETGSRDRVSSSTTQRRRDAPCLPSDVERIAVLVLDDWHQARIARQAARGFNSDRRSIFELTAPGGALLQRFRRNMDHDLVTIGPMHGFRSMLEETLGDETEGICPLHRA